MWLHLLATKFRYMSADITTTWHHTSIVSQLGNLVAANCTLFQRLSANEYVILAYYIVCVFRWGYLWNSKKNKLLFVAQPTENKWPYLCQIFCYMQFSGCFHRNEVWAHIEAARTCTGPGPIILQWEAHHLVTAVLQMNKSHHALSCKILWWAKYYTMCTVNRCISILFWHYVKWRKMFI